MYNPKKDLQLFKVGYKPHVCYVSAGNMFDGALA